MEIDYIEKKKELPLTALYDGAVNPSRAVWPNSRPTPARDARPTTCRLGCTYSPFGKLDAFARDSRGRRSTRSKRASRWHKCRGNDLNSALINARSRITSPRWAVRQKFLPRNSRACRCPPSLPSVPFPANCRLTIHSLLALYPSSRFDRVHGGPVYRQLVPTRCAKIQRSY